MRSASSIETAARRFRYDWLGNHSISTGALGHEQPLVG
jgi:tRNA(Ile)-lysidine synthase TilS/MesJ